MAAHLQLIDSSGLGRRQRLESEPSPRPPRKLAGKKILVLLVLLSMITGSLAGLTLVYSANLPQMDDLERYRPEAMGTRPANK